MFAMASKSKEKDSVCILY